MYTQPKSTVYSTLKIDNNVIRLVLYGHIAGQM